MTILALLLNRPMRYNSRRRVIKTSVLLRPKVFRRPEMAGTCRHTGWILFLTEERHISMHCNMGLIRMIAGDEEGKLEK